MSGPVAFFVFTDLSSVLMSDTVCSFIVTFSGMLMFFLISTIPGWVSNFFIYFFIFLQIVKGANIWRDPSHVFYNIYVMRIEHFYEFYFIIDKLIEIKSVKKTPLFVKKGFTNCQNLLLLFKLLFVIFLEWSFLAFLQSLLHLFSYFFQFLKFSLEGQS